jgi:ESCRT-II complex subunit VPS22
LFAGMNPVLELSESVSELILFPLQKQFTSHAGVQIVDICLATRPHNGGLLDLEELRGLLAKRRRASREPITEDDCLRAVSKLKSLGGGFEVFTVGRRKLVRSVPTELNRDHNLILELAQVGTKTTSWIL